MSMKTPYLIENIEGVRKKEGIVDAVLQSDVLSLSAGDRVKLSLSVDEKAYETVTVRITSVRSAVFRGKLDKKPRMAALKILEVGSSIVFQADHIHSVVSRVRSPKRLARIVEPAAIAAPKPRGMVRISRRLAPATAPLVGKSKVPAAKQNKRMSRRLQIEGDDKRRFIRVPIDIANALHHFLREKRVRSSPPQPYYSDCNCIELDRNIDVAGVQKLLNGWK